MPRFVSLRLLTLVVGLLTLEYCFAPFSSFFRGRLDLLYLLVLDYAFFWSWEAVPFFALSIGLLRDFVGGHLFGIETVSLTTTGFLLHLGMQKLERDNFWVRMGMSFLFIGLTEGLNFALGRGLEVSKGLSLNLMGGVFWTSLYTAALSPGFFWFTNRWFKRAPLLRQYELF